MRGGQRPRSFLFVVPPTHTTPVCSDSHLHASQAGSLVILILHTWPMANTVCIRTFAPRSSLEVGLQTYLVSLTF